MIIHRPVISLLACFLVLAFTAPVFAGERTYWQHKTGHFERTNEKRWDEHSPKGIFHFVEKEHTDKYVVLFDKSRDVTVRLYDHHCDVKNKTEPFKKIYEGHWGK
jgi:hypothetical protein